MSTTTRSTDALAAHDESADERDLGALLHVFGFGELDAAIEVLERVQETRADRRAARADSSPYVAMSADPDIAANRVLEGAIDQLREARRFDAIPDAALDAALAAAEGTSTAETDNDDDAEAGR